MLNHEHLLERKQQTKLFQSMSAFIGTMTNSQCRTHHQKQVRSPHNELEYIHEFYRINYRERMVGVDHLKKEIKHCFVQMRREVEGGPTGKQSNENRRLSLSEINRYE